jgi:hypothetical protein
VPESPRTRYRRPRAVNVAAKDRGRLTGEETTRDPALRPQLPGPQRPASGNKRIESQVGNELRPLHRWEIRWGPKHGTYRAWCTCGKWEAATPVQTIRAKTMWKDHVRRVLAAEVVRRRRAAGELRGIGAGGRLRGRKQAR